jgi:hypothetical protein
MLKSNSVSYCLFELILVLLRVQSTFNSQKNDGAPNFKTQIPAIGI